MDTMKDSLDTFLAAIRASQERTVNGLQNLSTVATFFSSVTATTLQFRYGAFDGKGENADKKEQFQYSREFAVGLRKRTMDELFSIASAIGAQLAYQWRTSQYRSLRIGAPSWVAVWIIQTPLCFLVGSVIAFALGLCLFTYSSDQSRVVKVLVTTFTIITLPALIGVGFWIVTERWVQIERELSRQLLNTVESPPVAGRLVSRLFGRTSINRPDNRVTVAPGRLKSAILSFLHAPHALAGRSAYIFSTMFDNSSRPDHRDEESQSGSITSVDSPTQNLPAESWLGALDRVTPKMKKTQPEELTECRGDATREDKASTIGMSAPIPLVNSLHLETVFSQNSGWVNRSHAG
ncbi:WD repeat protein [Ceratobasidium sp. AG-Ba]|nr:WD repeat protein [Ceratobasidium sp. AG-Ba]